MVEIFIWFLMIFGPTAGIGLIYFGVKSNRKERIPFKFRDLFFRTKEYEKSGTVDIIEGVACMFGSMILMYYYFF